MHETTELIQGIPVDPLTGAVSVPIYQTSTFVQDAPGMHKGYDYARTANPTRAVLEKLIADMEKGSRGLAFASGLAAIDAILKLLKSGDEVIAVDDIYGGAFRLFEQVYRKFGITVTNVDAGDPVNVFNALNKQTKLIWLETPSNPTLKIADIAAISAIAKSGNCLLCVDNTFASPVLQKPILLGADIVVHSATKYLGGHSDLIAGLVVTATSDLGEQIRFYQNAAGAILGPFDSWLVIRGMETLSLRMRQHCNSALEIAEFLQQHPAVDKVFYPGLKDHTNHNVAKKQARGFGGIVSFTLKEDTLPAARQFVSSTKLFKLAESLGGIKSLISHSAEMTHKTIPPDIRKAAGVKDSLIRLSVGLEDAEDLIWDLRNTFDSVVVREKKSSKRLENC